MRKIGFAAVMAVVLAGLPLGAGAVDLSQPKPQPRPDRPQVTVASSGFAGVLSTPRPRPRPGMAAPAPVVEAVALPMTTPMPRPRPRNLAAMAPQAQPAPVPQAEPAPVVETAVLRMTTPMPRPRPGNLDTSVRGKDKPKGLGFSLFKASARAPVSAVPVKPSAGSVCGDPSIRGKTLAPVVSKVRGCGIEDPVQITEVAGVRLSEAATIDCPTAIALKTWVETGLQPAFKGQVAKIRIAGHYVCRGRNNKSGAKISEHGRGRALDVSGLVLKDGSGLSIEAHYHKIKPLRAAHRAACGTFGTTLGPGSDGYHEDHLHFDTAHHSNGAYCR